MDDGNLELEIQTSTSWTEVRLEKMRLGQIDLNESIKRRDRNEEERWVETLEQTKKGE
jgi:hypothetical protein